VLLMPANSSPHKRRDEDPGAGHRLRMCELAVAGEEHVQACAVELAREAPSYTVETLERLHAAHPGVAWTFIAGADTARTLPSWLRPAQLLALARMAVALRAGSSREEVERAIGEVLEGAGADAAGAELERHVRFIEMPPVEVSSSQVRQRIARGEPVAELVGEGVARYIEEHGLYEPRGAVRA
jgi:nicotinate-nucleotide adenylyltransferase